MDISQISVAGCDIPSQLAERFFETARNSHWGRSFDDENELISAVNFRLNYLVNNLGIPANRVVHHLSFLVSPAGSSEEYTRYYDRQAALLEQNFRLGRASIAKSPTILTLSAEADATAPSSIRQKVLYLEEQCGFTHETIVKYPSILQYSIEDNGTPNCLPYKLRYLTKELGFGKRQFHKCPQILMMDCSEGSTNPANIRNKVAALEEVGLGQKQFRSCPNLLVLDCDPQSESHFSVQHKIALLGEAFGLSPIAWQQAPEILLSDCDPESTSETSIASKMRFLQRELGFSAAQINSYPQILGMDCSATSNNPAAIINKVHFYESMGVDRSVFLKFTNILGYDCDPNSKEPSAVVNKLRVIDELGIDRSVLTRMPILFGMPSNKIKIRYMLFNISPLAEVGMQSAIFIQNEAKTYARLKHIRATEYSANRGAIAFTESKFQSIFGKNSADLIAEYPLDRSAVRQVEDEYYAQVGQRVQLNKAELDAVCVKE